MEWFAHHWTWGVAVASIIGTVANIYKKPWCFVVWLFTNSIWCIYNLIIREYSQSLLWGVYTVLAVWGMVQWYREQERGVVVCAPDATDE